MGKDKEHPKYNVVSMRISDEEKRALEAMTRYSCKSISRLMREALQVYSPAISNTLQTDRISS